VFTSGASNDTIGAWSASLRSTNTTIIAVVRWLIRL
jgi:hypothetical protein